MAINATMQGRGREYRPNPAAHSSGAAPLPSVRGGFSYPEFGSFGRFSRGLCGKFCLPGNFCRV
jgi:hypothetical protein